MLDTLKSLDQRQVAGILAGLTLDVVPSAQALEEHSWTDLHQQILREARARLNIQADDWSEPARVRLADLLGGELRRHILTKERETAAKARLSAAGELWTSAYRIEVFKTAVEHGKVSEANIREVVVLPDAVQHLRPDWLPAPTTATGDIELISLFAKSIRSRKEPSITLVQAVRRADVLQVHAAWRVYLSAVNLPAQATPLAILTAFVETFGAPFYIGSTGEPILFCHYRKVPKTSGNTDVFTAPRPPASMKAAQMMLLRNMPDYVEVAMAYFIDLTKYLKCLDEKHRQR